MIRTLRGAFHPQADGTAVIETVAGIGFLVNLPANSTLYKKYEGEEVTAYTLMIVKEGHIIYQEAGALRAPDLDDIIGQAKKLDVAAALAEAEKNGGDPHEVLEEGEVQA